MTSYANFLLARYIRRLLLEVSKVSTGVLYNNRQLIGYSSVDDTVFWFLAKYKYLVSHLDLHKIVALLNNQ